MKTSKPYVEVAFTPRNTCKHHLWQGGIPVAAHKYTPEFSGSVLHSDIQVLAFPLGQGKQVPKMLPCGISREVLIYWGG